MKVLQVNVKDIKVVDNTRGHDLDLAPLMRSIKEVGLLQPLCLADNFTGGRQKYVVAAGHRRLEAIKKLGLKTVKAVLNPSIKSMKELIIVNVTENLQRKEVSAYEQGRFIDKLVTQHDMKLTEVAARLGISDRLCKSFLVVYRQTPQEYRNKVTYSQKSNKSNVGEVPVSVAVTLSNANKSKTLNAGEVKKIYKKVVDGELSALDVREVVQKARHGVKVTEALKAKEETSVVTVRIPLLNSQKNRIPKKSSVQGEILKLVYGERKKAFKRPQ